MAKYRQSKRWYAEVRAALGNQRPPEPFPRARVRYARYCGTVRPDDDNLESGFKWIQDGLVLCRVLADDKKENLETHHDWFPGVGKNKRVVITIEPIEPS